MVAPVAHMVPVIPMELLVEVVAAPAGPVAEQVVEQVLLGKGLQVAQTPMEQQTHIARAVAVVPAQWVEQPHLINLLVRAAAVFRSRCLDRHFGLEAEEAEEHKRLVAPQPKLAMVASEVVVVELFGLAPPPLAEQPRATFMAD